jgi:hypothetical protein
MLPARWLRLKRKAAGLVRVEALRRRGIPASTANAHARFEQEAKHAKREWLML